MTRLHGIGNILFLFRLLQWRLVLLGWSCWMWIISSVFLTVFLFSIEGPPYASVTAGIKKKVLEFFVPAPFHLVSHDFLTSHVAEPHVVHTIMPPGGGAYY